MTQLIVSLLIVALVVALAARSVARRLKGKAPSCSCGCAGCPAKRETPCSPQRASKHAAHCDSKFPVKQMHKDSHSDTHPCKKDECKQGMNRRM